MTVKSIFIKIEWKLVAAISFESVIEEGSDLLCFFLFKCSLLLQSLCNVPFFRDIGIIFLLWEAYVSSWLAFQCVRVNLQRNLLVVTTLIVSANALFRHFILNLTALLLFTEVFMALLALIFFRGICADLRIRWLFFLFDDWYLRGILNLIFAFFVC